MEFEAACGVFINQHRCIKLMIKMLTSWEFVVTKGLITSRKSSPPNFSEVLEGIFVYGIKVVITTEDNWSENPKVVSHVICFLKPPASPHRFVSWARWIKPWGGESSCSTLPVPPEATLVPWGLNIMWQGDVLQCRWKSDKISNQHTLPKENQASRQVVAAQCHIKSNTPFDSPEAWLAEYCGITHSSHW